MSFVKEAVESLRAAVVHGRTDIVRSLITAASECKDENDVNVIDVLNHIDGDHGTVLHLASKQGQADVARALLAAGADPSIKDSQGDTAYDVADSSQVINVYHNILLQAVAKSDVDSVKQLINAGVTVNVKDGAKSSNTPLHWGASYGNAEVLQCLLDNGALVNAANGEGATPLHDAVHRGDRDIVEVLVQHKANPAIKASTGNFADKTPADLAASKKDILEILDNLPVIENEIPVKMIPNGDAGIEIKPTQMNGIDRPSKINVTPTPNVQQQPIASPQLPSPSGSDNVIDKLNEMMSSANVRQPPPALVTDTRLHLLWPQPQKILQQQGTPFQPNQLLKIQIVTGPEKVSLQDIVDVWSSHGDILEDLEYQYIIEPASMVAKEPSPDIICQVNSRMFTVSGSYKITVSSNKITILACDLPGLWFSLCTLTQLFRLCKEEGIPQVQITDWSDLPNRGIMLDLSYGRILKMDHLLNLVDSLTLLKVNQLYLYVKIGYEDLQTTLPYHSSELLDLDTYCQRRFITVIPHLDVIEDGPLKPLQLSMIQHIVAQFPSADFVNIGPMLSRLLIETNSLIGNNISVLPMPAKFSLLGVQTHQTVQLCANVLHGKEEILSELPLGVVLMEYGQKATYDFQQFGRVISKNGIGMFVCPGSAAWDSIGGCPEAAVRNIFHAVQCSQTHSSMGLLLTDWAGNGCLSHQPISWPAYLCAAGLAWNHTSHWDFIHSNLPELINKYVYMDQSAVIGQVTIEVGRAETYLIRAARGQSGTDSSELPPDEGSLLYRILTDPDEVSIEKLTPDIVQKALLHARRCQNLLGKAVKTTYNSIVLAELQVTTDLLLLMCKVVRALVIAGQNPDKSNTGLPVINVGLANLSATTRTDIANKLLEISEQFRQTWLGSNLPTGLKESLALLHKTLKQLIPESDR
ncbi:uncharacterized protein LOC144452238 [Glandiceps talaboti]